MLKPLVILAAGLIASVAQAAAPPASAPAPIESTATGDIRTHKLHSRNLPDDRNLYVWLPPGYNENRDKNYAVLYMHDGQNLFDKRLNPVGEWQADETAARLIKEKKIEPLIIVGIANTGARMDEYTLTADPGMQKGGKGDAYIRLIATEVKPFIDRMYRTKKDPAHTGVGGSSLGATISIEICREHPEMFGRCAVISPALWWNRADLLRRMDADHAWVKNCRFWIDIGTNEAPPDQMKILLGTVNTLAEILKDGGLQEGKDFQLHLVDGATHIETAWAKRFDQVLMFLFPPEL